MTEKSTETVRGTEVTVVHDGPYKGRYGPGYVVGKTEPEHCGHDYKIGECPICWLVEPTVEGHVDNSVERHPAYALVAASHASGRARLFGTEWEHQHFVTVRVSGARLHRGLSSDRPHPTEEYIEVAMSEAQWATFISTPNSGVGVPCTLLRRNGEMVSRLPKPKPKTEQFAGEMQQRLGAALKAASDLRARLATGKSGKAALDLLDAIERELLNNTKFVAEQFGEYMEATVERAKVEVSTYVTRAAQQAGLQALRDGGSLDTLPTREAIATITTEEDEG